MSRIIPHYLPHDLVVEILSRLPVNSLLRFKCVCKTWLSLIISDPSFAILQYKQSAENSPQKILISTSSLLQSLDCSATTSSFGGDGALRKLDFPYKRADSIVHVIGSCDGLVCVALGEYEQFFIWNPTTGAYRRLPEVDTPIIVNRKVVRYSYGFGYDSSSKDYKVYFALRSVDCGINEAHARVFATKTNSWRRIQLNSRIQCCDTYYFQRPRGSLLNGSLHWLIHWCCDRHFNFTAIAAFDLAEEKLIELPMPKGGVYFDSLGVVDGFLCSILSTGRNKVQLWIMKEYGVQSSWEKLYNIVENCNDIFYRRIKMVALCSTRCGEEVILINNGNELIRSNPNKKTHEHLMITSKAEAELFLESTEATAYIESLLPPQ